MTTITISGGAKLEARLKELSKKVAKKATLRVGFLEGATYPDGTPVATVAAIQEYGAPKVGIPPRPFFRSMVAAKKGAWGDALARSLVAADYDATQALDLVGEGIQGQLQESITNLDEPALSPVTLMLREMFPMMSDGVQSYKDVAEARARVAAGESADGVSTKPLVWTGHLLNSVSHEVEE